MPKLKQPRLDATEYVGLVERGRDKKWWKSVQTKSGVIRWYRVKAPSSPNLDYYDKDTEPFESDYTYRIKEDVRITPPLIRTRPMQQRTFHIHPQQQTQRVRSSIFGW